MKKGDFLRIEYTGRIAATGELFDTTSEEVAKKENAFNPKQRYGPVLAVIGAGMAVPGVERNLLEMKEGEEREFDLKPPEAFGPRDPSRIRIIALAKFVKEKINPYPGAFVNIDGMDAKIQSVSGGRVRVDFNHPLAGRELHYKLKLLFRIVPVQEKAFSLLDHYNFKGERELKESVLEIATEQPIQEVIQKMLSESIKKWIPEIKDVKFSVSEPKKPETPGKTETSQKPDVEAPKPEVAPVQKGVG
jgi:FKBP-type peptidyl-prolyl cis-trans isomerase 2